MKKVSIILFLSKALILGIDFNVNNCKPCGVTINRVTTVKSAFIAWAVGDSGQVFKLSQTGWILPNYPITLNAEYNLTGVSFATPDTGWIVGYKRDSTANGPKWKGAVWKTTDGGANWIPIDTLSLPRFSVPTPFLDVHAVSDLKVWISCGHGEVLRTIDGGVNWMRITKPGSPNHFGWLWGIDAQDENTAWVCSDGTGLIAKTTDGGNTWTNYKPYEADSLSYFDIDFYNDEAVAAASKGRLLADSNSIWNEYFPFGNYQTAQSFHGSFNLDQKWGVGSGGMIGTQDNDSARKYWFSRRYDLRDIEGIDCLIDSMWKRYFMVGTNASILFGEESEMEEGFDANKLIQLPKDDPDWSFDVVDYSGDHGWQVEISWDTCGADSYRLYCKPKSDMSLNGTTDNGPYCWIKTTNNNSLIYDSSLTGQKVYYAVVAHLPNGETRCAIDSCIATDDIAPPKVTGLNGYYNSDLDAGVLQWNPIAHNQEPNLAGYWVKSRTDAGGYEINNSAPVSMNYCADKFPGGNYRTFQIQAMDRSDNRSGFGDSCRFYVPEHFATSPYATAFNQGRHLVRLTGPHELHIAYENGGKIVYSYSEDDGVHWTKEIIGNGFFPSIGVAYKELPYIMPWQPWIAFWRDGDIICKVKRMDGDWLERVVFDGNDSTVWAGAPAIMMGTIPDIIPQPPIFTYIAYAVYEGDKIPSMPSPPPYPSHYSGIRLSILDTLNIAHYVIDEGDSINIVSNPAIAVTPADWLHLVWEKEDEIWYTTNIDPINYENWQYIEMYDKVNISESPEMLSQHPFVEAYGENVLVAWKENNPEEPGEILRRVKNLSYPDWGEIEIISQSPDVESDYPVLSTSDVVAFQEGANDLTYEIYAWIQGDLINLSETENSSQFPHITVEPQELGGDTILDPEIVINAIWTEAIPTDSLYDVKFKRYQHNQDFSVPIKYISVSVGDSNPSPYCEQRDGYIQYGEYSLDYSRSSLSYNIPFLHPKSNYLLKALVYQKDRSSWQEKMYVDSTLVVDLHFDPNIAKTVNIILPRETYQPDFRIRKEIEKILGKYALVADLKVYEVKLPDSGGIDGIQDISREMMRTVLYQNRPNPFKSRTVISFSLAKESKVACLIFDASGRKVRTIVNDKLQPGHYNLKWDGKDNHNRKLAQGIYFYRLQTEDFQDTKKTILLK